MVNVLLESTAALRGTACEPDSPPSWPSYGSLRLGKRHKDESNGFQITTPSKWDQVPAKFQEVSIVGKWAAPRVKGRYLSNMLVLRFLKNRIEDAANPMEALRRGIPGYGGVLQYQAKDLWTYIPKHFAVRAKDVREDVAEFKMSSKKYRAHYRVYMRGGSGGDRNTRARRLVVIGAKIDTVEETDSTFGVIFSMSELDFEDWERGVQTIIKRFKILESDEEDAEEGGSDADIFADSTKKPEAWRNARKSKLIKGWNAIDTENYLIVYNKQVKKPLLKNIAKHIEAIRKQVYEPMFPPTKEVKAISVVRVCKDRAEYGKYGGPPGSAGYWSRGDEELVFYQDKANKKDSLRVLYHEAFRLPLAHRHHRQRDCAEEVRETGGVPQVHAGPVLRQSRSLLRAGLVVCLLPPRGRAPQDQEVSEVLRPARPLLRRHQAQRQGSEGEGPLRPERDRGEEGRGDRGEEGADASAAARPRGALPRRAPVRGRRRGKRPQPPDR
jgi:hypothetical protein